MSYDLDGSCVFLVIMSGYYFLRIAFYGNRSFITKDDIIYLELLQHSMLQGEMEPFFPFGST